MESDTSSTYANEDIDLKTLMLNKTWSIRTISQFIIPFVKRLPAEEFVSNDLLRQRQNHMTHFVRQRYTAPTTAINSTNQGFPIHPKLGNCGEIHVNLTWLTLPQPPVTLKTSNASRRSRARGSPIHIYIPVTVDDKVVTSLLLCYSTWTKNSTDLMSFSYLLHRGNTHIFSIICTYFETILGCHISPNVFHPSSSNVISSMAQWSVIPFLLHQQEHPKTAYSPKGSATNKPLELTFQTPSHIQEQGLSYITITIPPASVERLNISIAEILLPEPQQQRHKLYSKDEATLPTLQAIQFFLQNTFHIDITSFPLTRVSCNDIGIIGCDGRIKLFSLPFVDLVLKGIQGMVDEKYANLDIIE